MQEWKFVEELKAPPHSTIAWERLDLKEDEADLRSISLESSFPDDNSALETAYCDFKEFLKAGKIQSNGPYKIITERSNTKCFESYRIIIEKNECRIQANDTEGIRRGLVYLEDELLRAGGPFLPLGTIKRKPLIKTRMSRCFFGPIKRPPINRDELADDINYYPDEYLNKLAHEGINALWMTISFKDLCPSEIFPEHAKDNKKRLRKLRQTVKQCGRYGIKIYAFCIEPQGFGKIKECQEPLSILEKHPDLAGHKTEHGTYFCTSSEKGKKYLEDCTYYLFSQVPGLGGLIDINMGERPTHCYSSTTAFSENNCPLCSKRAPWEVFAETTGAIAKGMQKASPEAEMISWLYVPCMDNHQRPIEDTMQIIKKIAAHTPENVTLQYNFESLGKVDQLGKERVALDYWLSWPGPSDIFKDVAKNAIKNGARASAKIQTGCSHEVATVPFLPAPGNLYRKYEAMHKLGISSVMQCWYFGNYPGLMNKSSGELSFAPFPESETEFLLKTAKTYWDKNAEKLATAWKHFQEGYSNFPINLSFTWYGPLHHSIVWPLYLYPADKPISPSWKFTFPLESGDRIGECICYDHTLEEVLELLKRMSEEWERGTEILKSIETDYSKNQERLLDIGLAKALGIQIKSSKNLFDFYAAREKLPFLKQKEQQESLEAMKKIVEKEIKNCKELKELCLKDSRLGFHSEAEGYKYFPAKLDWRKEKLQQLLDNDFPKLEKEINNAEEIFPEYTGAKPQGKIYRISEEKKEALLSGKIFWKAEANTENILFEIEGDFSQNEEIVIDIEPRRLWPTQKFIIAADGKKYHHNLKVNQDRTWSIERSDKKVKFTIPFKIFEGYYKAAGPMRINVSCGKDSWIQKAGQERRLRFGIDNPSELGWIIFN
jgi:hypothetical protein